MNACLDASRECLGWNYDHPVWSLKFSPNATHLSQAPLLKLHAFDRKPVLASSNRRAFFGSGHAHCAGKFAVSRFFSSSSNFYELFSNPG
jgi:hypothetical protein